MYRERLCVFAAAILMPFIAVAREEAQEPSQAGSNPKPKIEIVAGIAVGHPFRFDDQGFGNGVNFGAGVEIPAWRGLRFGAEMNRTFGLSPSPAPCWGISLGPGQPPLPCVGTAHYGVSAATAASFAAAYFFGHGRVQPYIVGGLSML
jgi:hypothetical protein